MAMVVAFWAAWLAVGGEDADNSDSGLGYSDTVLPGPSWIGAPGPPWGVPAATPTPTPTPAATPGPPEPTAAAASPAEAGTTPERGPQPEPAGERPAVDPEGIPAGPEALVDDPVEIIHQVFGQNAGAALAVAWCETGGTFDPGAVGDEGERGLFQIHPIHFAGLDADRLFEPLYNAQIAYGMSAGGMDWGPWRNCQP